MAKKIKKQKMHTTPGRLFMFLVVPWVVMGVLAIVLFGAGAPDYLAILGGLAGSLLVTYYIRGSMTKRRTRM